MKSVKTMQRYQCDYCKKRSTKHVMELHEKRCFRNPNRFCDKCQNTGKYMQEVDGPYGNMMDIETNCPYCSKFDPKIKEAIEKWEQS